MTRAAAALLALLLAAAPAAADVVLDLRYGHGGGAVAGALTPVRLRVTNRETGPLAVTFSARPARSSPDESFAQADLAPGTTKDLFLLVRPARYAAPHLEARFDRPVRVTRGRETNETPGASFEIPLESTALALTTIHVLAVGPSAGVLPNPQVSGLFDLLTAEESDLPPHPLAYDGIDVVYWRNPGEGAPLDPDVVAALLRWTALGGRLVVSATRRPEILAGSGLARILPAVPAAPVPDSDYVALLRPILGRSGATDRFLTLPPGPVTPLPDGAAALTRTVGFGTATVLAFDPARLAERLDPEAAAAVLNLVLGIPGRASRERLAQAASASSELDWSPAHQIPSALLRALREATAPSTPVGLLMIFLFLYVVAVGPVDYLVLKRMRKLQYSALSLILLAVAFSAAAFVAAFVVFAGGREIRRVTVVDVAPDPAADGADLVRIEDYVAVYAPRGGDLLLPAAGLASVTDRLIDPENYEGGLTPGILSGGLARDFRSPVAARAVLGVPFRATRYLRSVHLRSEPFPVSCRAVDGEPVLLTNGLSADLAGASLAGPDLLVPLGEAPARGEASFAWLGMPAKKYLQVPAPGGLFAGLRSPVDLGEVGRGLVMLSLAPAGHGDPDTLLRADWRLVARFGLQRPGRLAAGGRVLAAYTLAPDPLGLPLATTPGHSVTVFRKVIEP